MKQNKSTLTGPADCKETTRHYAESQGKLKMQMQSRENGQKPQFGQFFEDFEVKYLQIAHSSEK